MSSSSSARVAEGEEPDPKKSRKDYYEYIGFEDAAALLRVAEGATRKKDTAQSQEKINCYGVVVSFTQPKELHNKASKYMASYFIVDPTMPYNATSASVCLNIFADELSQLPKVYSAGDILRCHRVKVNFWNGLQLVGTIHGEKSGVRGKMQGSSFVTFHGKFDPSTGLLPADPAGMERAQVHSSKDGPKVPHRASSEKVGESLGSHYFEVHATSKEFSWNEEELKLVRGYRTWAASMLMKHCLQDSLTPTFNLEMLTQLLGKQAISNERKGGTVIPNTCDVIGIFVGMESRPSPVPGRSPQDVALIWDGTQALGSMIARPEHTTVALLGNAAGKVDGVVPRETLQAVEATVHASCIYQSCVELTDVETLRPRILALDKENPPQSYMGAPVAFEVADPGSQKFFASLKPGAWLRFRALRLTPGVPAGLNVPPSAPIPRVAADTHVVMLPPYAHDPARIATDFRARIQEGCRLMSEQKINAAAAPSAQGAGARGGGGGGGAMPPPPARRSLFTTSAGEELTSIALLQATPAPAKFVLRAHVSSYWPQDITKFTVDANVFNAEIAAATGAEAPVLLGQKKKPAVGADGTDENSENASPLSALDIVSGRVHKPREYLFSICVADDSGDIDLIFSGRDAELLLGGVSADDFHAAVEAEQAAAAGGAAGDAAATASAASLEIATPPVPGAVLRVKQRLDELVASKTHSSASTRDSGILQFYVRSYTDIQGTGVGKVLAPSEGGGKTAPRTLPIEYKRFAGFNTKLFQ